MCKCPSKEDFPFNIFVVDKSRYRKHCSFNVFEPRTQNIIPKPSVLNIFPSRTCSNTLMSFSKIIEQTIAFQTSTKHIKKNTNESTPEQTVHCDVFMKQKVDDDNTQRSFSVVAILVTTTN